MVKPSNSLLLLENGSPFYFTVKSETMHQKNTMHDSAKRGSWPTSEPFTVILCDPNFAVS